MVRRAAEHLLHDMDLLVGQTDDEAVVVVRDRDLLEGFIGREGDSVHSVNTIYFQVRDIPIIYSSVCTIIAEFTFLTETRSESCLHNIIIYKNDTSQYYTNQYGVQ